MVINPGPLPGGFWLWFQEISGLMMGYISESWFFRFFIFALEHELAWFEYAQRIQALPNHASSRLATALIKN